MLSLFFVETDEFGCLCLPRHGGKVARVALKDLFMPGRFYDREPRVSTQVAAAVSRKQPCGPRIEDVHGPRLQRRLHDSAAKSHRAQGIGKSRHKHSLKGRQWKRAEVQSSDDAQCSKRPAQEDVQLGSATDRHDGETLSRSEAENFSYLSYGTGQQGCRGAAAIDLIGCKRFRTGVDAAGADELCEPRGQRFSDLAHAFPPADCGKGCRRVSPQPLPSGKTFPGLSRPTGLNAARTLRIKSRSVSVNMRGMSSFFSMPTPCSPVSVPPISTQSCMISAPAALARRN